jgi:hypothetical protein
MDAQAAYCQNRIGATVLQEDHLAMLMEVRRTYNRANEEPAPRSGWSWMNSLGLSAEHQPPGIAQCASKPNRDALFQMVADRQQDTPSLCAAIFAWGGMHVRHGRELFRTAARWREAAEMVRFGNLSRTEAYALFHRLRAEGVLPGMGPAYYTKLIFFLRGSDVADPGYIMDQWTGCSINLLLGQPGPVLMNAAFTWTTPTTFRSDFQVSEMNDAGRYERFCSGLEAVAEAVGLDPIHAELLLMSQGRGRGVWRRHVLAHRQAPTAG